MKKVYLSVVALCFAMSAMAQVQVGPKLGLNLNKIADGEDTPDGTKEPFKAGINLGAAFSFSINETIAIAPELTYSQKGGKLKSENNDDFEFAQTLNYLDVPVLIRASFGELIKGYINAGPTFNYWLGGKNKATFDGESEASRIVFVDKSDTVEDNEAPYLKEHVNRLEIGGAIGGGVMFDTGNGSDLLLDLRYNAGFNNLLSEEALDEGKYQNRGISLSIVYLLGVE